MKLIYISRLFTSVENFISGKAEDINGMPAVMSFLAHSTTVFNEVEWIILLNSSASEKLQIKKIEILKKKLGITKITICDIKTNLSKIRLLISLSCDITKNDILYLHNSAFWLGFLKLISPNVKINLRLTGMPQGVFSIFSKKGMFNLIKKYAYTQKFANIVFTEDGGSHFQFSGLLGSQETKRHFIVNGCNFKNQKKRNIDSVKYVTFIGRFHWSKGIQDFLDLAQNYKNNANVKFRIAGYGDEEKKILNYTHIENLEYIRQPSRREVEQILNDTHILISPNRVGFLSNVVIEALSTGAFILSYNASYQNGIHFSARAKELNESQNLNLNSQMFFYQDMNDLEKKYRELILKYPPVIETPLFLNWNEVARKELRILMDDF